MIKNFNILVFGFFITISSLTFANADFETGMKLVKQKDYKSAIESFKKVIKIDPYNSSSYYNQGYCLFELHKYGEAIYCFEKALKYDPKNANCLKNLEVCHFKLEQPSYEPIHSGTMRSFFAFGGNNWAFSAIACSILFSLMIILFKNRKSTNSKRLFLVGGIFFFVLGIGCAWFAAATNEAFHNSEYAIVTDKSIPTFDETGQKTTFVLYEGDRLQILPPTQKSKINVRMNTGREVIIDGAGWLHL